MHRSSAVDMPAQMRMEAALLTFAAALIIATIWLVAPQLDVTLNEVGTEVLGVGPAKPNGACHPESLSTADELKYTNPASQIGTVDDVGGNERSRI